METLQNYFALPDTPSAGSPVGTLMVRILAKFPDLSFDAARDEARRLLYKAAGRFYFTTPKVLSSEQRQTAKTRFQSLNDARKKALDTPALAFPDPPSTIEAQ